MQHVYSVECSNLGLAKSAWICLKFEYICYMMIFSKQLFYERQGRKSPLKMLHSMKYIQKIA